MKVRPEPLTPEQTAEGTGAGIRRGGVASSAEREAIAKELGHRAFMLLVLCALPWGLTAPGGNPATQWDWPAVPVPVVGVTTGLTEIAWFGLLLIAVVKLGSTMIRLLRCRRQTDEA